MKNLLLPLFLSFLVCSAHAATLVVDSPDDSLTATSSGACTLRGAVAAINSGGNANGCTGTAYGSNDTIEFDSSLSGITIPVVVAGTGSNPGGGIDIEKTLIITGLLDGSGNPAITLNGNDTNRIFHVTGGTSLSITGVTFTHGKADFFSGGAIWVSTTDHTLTLKQCAFEGNQAASGGAVSAQHLASRSNTVIISNSSFSSNEASSSSGAVFADTAIIDNSSFTGNTASSSGGGAVIANKTATISNSSFTGNTATYGGAVLVSGDGDGVISNSTFTNNTATNTDDFGGGAVLISGSGGGVISNSTFSGNTANTRGGAVVAATATISNSTFTDNEATTGGGAVYAFASLNARHLTLLNNTAGTDGQALWVDSSSGSATLHNSIIIGGNNGSQCTGEAGATITGSHNLEGYEASGSWINASSATCGTSIASPPTNGTPLNTIIDSTLDDHGGPTQTLALSAGSPAIGAADPTGANSETHDQRGYTRMAQAYGRDLGAYEALRIAPSPNLPYATVGTPYSQNLQAGGCLPATAGGTDCNLTFTSTSLPNWLALGVTNGLLSGTPPAASLNMEFFFVTVQDNIVGVTPYGADLHLNIRALPTGSTPIPVLPVPLLLGLAVAVGLLGRRRLTQRA